MSLGHQTVVDVGMYGAGIAPKVGYTNGKDGATPLCHVGIFLGACSYRSRSLLISLRTPRGMPLTKRLERHGGLFLDSAPTLFFGVGRPGNRELPEDNSSSTVASLLHDKTSRLPLFCLIRSVGWLLPLAFSP